MRRVATGIRSEKCVVRRFRRCANVYLHKPRQYSIAYAHQAIWYSLLLLGYKPVQHVTVLNTVGNCNTVVSVIILYYNIKILGDRGSTVVKLLCYKSEGRRFDPR
jgi:isoprenylcysteine carboxyl methyltransferase (ICMT) family protein YpbQ